MSDDSDVNPGKTRRKRNALVGDNSDSSIETISRRRRRRKHKNYVRESDTESDSSVEILRKKKRVHRVASDSDGSSSGESMIIKTTRRNVTAMLTESDDNSSGSEVIKTKKTITALVTDSESDDANDSDSEYDSDWVTEPEPENNCKTTNNTKPDTHIEDKGAASDSSDGQTEKCPICLLPFKSQEVASPESCDHCFCVDCIVEWSKNVNTCPVDRQPFNLVLVRKNYNGKVVKQIPIDSPQQQNEVDEIVEDPTFCEICGRCDREDRMLLCDGCDLGYHLECLTPPLADIPIGAWFCADCGPELRVDDPMIDIYEVHLLLEDAETLGWPTGPRRRNTTAPRLVPRTRQSERVRARIITHRNQRRDDRRHEHNETLQSHEAAQNLDQPGPSSSSPRNRSSTLTSVKRNKKRRYKKRKKRKSNIKITYEIDEVTGEKIAIQTKIKRRYKRKQTRKTRSQRNKARCVARAKTVKKRLAVQLGMCPPKVNQTLPDMRIQHNSSSIGLQRSQAGIPTLHLFGQRNELDYFSRSNSEFEEEGDGVNVVVRRRPQLSDASILRRAVRRKSVIVPQVTSTSNILDSILDSQSKFHSKNTVLSLNKDGTVIVDKSNSVKSNRDLENNLNMANRNMNVNRNRINFNNYNNAHTRQTPMYGNSNGTNEGIPISSNTTDFVRRNSSENQTVSTSSTEAVRSNRLNNDANSDPNYLMQTVCSSYDSELENKKDKDKDKTRSNTPATHSDSEFDIYSDIETVSTSRAEESDIKAPPSPPRLGTPNTPTDEDANNSDADLVIDTEKVESEKFDDSKEQVSSTVDSTGPTIMQKIINSHAPHSTSDVQHEIVQSSGQNDNRGSTKRIVKSYDDDDDNDEDSEDGCPNFSIYSTESIKLAKNTDLQLLNDNSLSGLPVQSVNTSNEVKDKYKSYNNEPESLVGTSIYSDSTFMINSFHNETTSVRPESSENALSYISDNEKENDEPEVTGMTSKAALKSGSKNKYQLKMKSDKPVGLYSDSEDESLIKINHDKPFGIGDLRNMTEDISEEERSYTPCLDEKAPVYKQGLEGLETELISDEDRNDFDESHELKTVSEGDALEINAKESELDFTKPEDYEEGEIVDKLKAKMAEEDSKKLNSKEKENTKESDPKTDDRNKENEADNAIIKEASSFKKLSKNTKERNYRDKDKGDKEKERSKSREKKDKSDKEKEKKKKEKRKEIERYNVRSMIAEKPRRVTKDKFGRELRGRRSGSKSSLSLTPPRRSLSRELRRSRSRSKKRRARSRPRRSVTRSRSPERKKSRSPRAKKRRSLSRDKNKPRRKSRDRSKNKMPKENQARQKSRSVSPRRRRDFGSRRHSRGWSRSLTRSISPEQRLTPSWTPPRLMETQTVRPRNLTVILNNDLNKKKKEKKKKEKRAKELEKTKRRKKDRTPPPSKEVFASGNNILVSVSFNKDNNERDVSKRKRDASCADEISTKRTRKEKEKRKKDDRRKKRNQAVSGLKPVAIIDLERSPFREIIPAAEDVIVLTDSENGESNDLLALQTAVCDSSQQVVSPERSVNTNYLTGPKTPPEPQVKFSLTAKQPQLRAISNPLHEPDDLEGEIDPQEELEQRLNESLHKGPNTPPEPPNSPPSSPDVYDPFDPTKSRSPTPEPIPQTVQSSTSQNDNTRDESLMDSRNDDDLSTLTDTKSHTPPVVTDIQPADSQSNVKATTPEKSPEHQISVIINQVVQSQASIFPTVTSKPLPTFSTASSMITSTPLANLGTPRINIINSTILTPATVASAVPQRIVLPNTIKSSPVKVSPNKLPIKSTPIKPMPVKALINKSSLQKRKRNQENADVTLDFDSPYSPGSSDYEDLFEPPPDAGIKKPPLQQPQQQSQKNTKSPAKMQSAFDTLFGSSPVNPNFKKNSNKTEKSKHKKNVKGSKLVGVKIDEDTLKILDELPNSAVEMQVKDKYLKKLNRQERVVDEVKLVLKPHYNKKHINKEEYKDILRRAVPKICHNKSGEINPKKIQNLIEAYVKKIRHSKKVTSSSSSMNPQKA